LWNAEVQNKVGSTRDVTLRDYRFRGRVIKELRHGNRGDPSQVREQESCLRYNSSYSLFGSRVLVLYYAVF